MTNQQSNEQPTAKPSVRVRRPPTWLLAAVGVVVGGLLGWGLSALLNAGDGDNDGDSMPLAPIESLYPDDQAANAEAFLEAWSRHRMATYRAELTFSRELSNGQRIDAERIVLQQPPRRAIRQSGSVTEVGSEDSSVCEPIGDSTVCTRHAGTDYELEVAHEVAAWRTAITGELPAYAITVSSPGCFELQLAQPMADPPYGELSHVCFDDETGALESRQVFRANATEIEQATSLTATVTEADWQAIRA